ncbi:alpha/beta-hydrolase [Mycena rosella]|uniref:Alpha/beta-hydrolase n=1 Tax=Mycena rosella TaxID=1033263 RepID=A0AAD7G3A4_MYCRO|nr:alpha/beta-hydrolase [Mycena rosella]
MPHILITSAGGPLSVCYTISTPTATSAKAIDPVLPTVLLLHPVYLGQIALHHQFADAHLRRFNLVALDLRGHGNSVGAVKPTYGVAEAVDDVVNFLESLHLPPVHIVGVDLGSLVALELAAIWPQRVISLSLISPPALEEPADVAQGRQEIYDCWEAGFGGGAQGEADESALFDAVCGALQLGVNNMQTPMVSALVKNVLGTAMANWAPPKLDEYHRITIDFYTSRPRPTLRGIACPVQIVHCGEDIAYPRECAEELLDALRAVDVDARMHEVPDAVQWGNITHYAEINPLIHNMVTECAVERHVPPARKAGVESPYIAALIESGLQSDGREEFDDDSDCE